MWGSDCADATSPVSTHSRRRVSGGIIEPADCIQNSRLRGAERNASGPLPGLERADLPVALLLLAGLTLHPGLRTARNEAGEEVAARLSVLGVGGGDWRDRAARSGARIFPRHARILFAAAEHGGCGGPRIGEIGGRRQLRLFLAAGLRHRTGTLGLVAGREKGIQLIGQAASADGKRQEAARGQLAP